MPIYLFERTVFPRRFGSPFIVSKGKVKGPGGIGGSVEKVEGGEKTEGAGGGFGTSGAGTGRKRPRRTAGVDGPSKGLYVGPTGTGASLAGAGVQQHPYTYQPSQAQQTQQQQPKVDDRSIVGAAGALAAHAHVEKLPSETGEFGFNFF